MLSDWSRIISEMGERRERELQEYIIKFRERMPTEVATLPTISSEALLGLFLQFTAGTADARKTMAHAEFAEHVKAEILRRMGEAK